MIWFLSHARSWRFLLTATLLCATYFSLPGPHGINGQEKAQAVVEASIMVIAKGRAKKDEANDLRTLLVLMKSPLILERAIKKHGLASLKSFGKDAGSAAEIQRQLFLASDPGSSGTIISLTYRSASADDGVRVVSAILASFQEFVETAYRDVGDETVRSMANARDLIEKEISGAEEKYRNFRLNNRPSTEIDKRISTERILALEHKKTDILIHQMDLRSKLQRGEVDTARLGLQIEIHEWSAKIGFDKLPKPIQQRGQVAAYKEHLKEKLDGLVAAAKGVDQLLQDENQKMRAITQYEREDEVLRKNIERLQQLFEAILKRTVDVDLLRDTSGFATHVISPPRAKKAP